MKISEIFYSIQGEGVNAGKRAIFVRFFGCNLSCSWCDTKYSWHPKYAEWKEMDLEEIVQKICSYNCTHVIFTGGEPSLFQKEILEIVEGVNVLRKAKNSPNDVETIHELSLQKNYTYEIETNGTRDLSKIDKFLSVVNVSPKLRNSVVRAADLPPLRAISKKYFYKFVIAQKSDIHEILEMQKKYNLKKILLMPEGSTREAQFQRVPMIQLLCKKYGFEYSPRLHIFLWDNQRGV
ncbi:7-carboxy-7-deazaguanine synthase QueE [Candidatus Peregrinibacteria bacterium]|nr:7-carboxy-7-deazaguanine synthase QueE [Candidatus Peregrinibacteria bacterium]